MLSQEDKGSAILVVHFIVGDAAVLVAKVGTRWSATVYRGEWVYHTHREVFKDKARFQEFWLKTTL